MVILSNDLRWMCKVKECFSAGIKCLGASLVPALCPCLFSGCVAGTAANQPLAVALAGVQWQQLLAVAPAVICQRNWLLQCWWDVGCKEWVTARCVLQATSLLLVYTMLQFGPALHRKGTILVLVAPENTKQFSFKHETRVLNWLWSLTFKVATSLWPFVELGWSFEAFIFLLLPLNFLFVQNVRSHTPGRIFTSSALEDTCKMSLLKTWSNVVCPPQINCVMAHFPVNIIFCYILRQACEFPNLLPSPLHFRKIEPLFQQTVPASFSLI